ncbi:MAG: rhomboid family intramembrane serine protease [Planctomycetota bacterium]
MGLHDRDYERSWDTGSGWRDGGNYGDGGARLALPSSANNRLLVLLAGVYLLQTLIDPSTDGAFTEALTLPADWFQRPWRAYGLLTYGLVHGGLWHLLGNGLGLFFFGRAIEQRFGGREYLCFLGTAVVVGGVVWSVAELVAAASADQPMETLQRNLLLGASAGVASVVVAFGLLNPTAKVLLFLTIPVPAIVIAAVLVYSDAIGAMSMSGNVAYTAHLGGAAFGYLYLRQITGRGLRLSQMPPYRVLMGVGGVDWKEALRPKPKLKIHRDEEPSGANDAAAERMDQLLRKIQSSGIDSLTREERRFMERTSRELKKRRT